MRPNYLFTALFLILSCFTAVAQDVFETFNIPGLPVSFRYNKDFPVKPIGKSGTAFIATDGKTEFYIKLMRIGARFNSDSLKAMMMKEYEDPSVKNIQASEVASGMLGNVVADKVVLSFSADKMYLSTALMAHFYMNSKYNAILFYYEMNERYAPPYASIQETMLQTLRYLPFNYKEVKDTMLHMVYSYPDHWNTIQDSLASGFTDGRAFISVSTRKGYDTLALSKVVDSERDKMKIDAKSYPELKVKGSTEKVNKELCGKIVASWIDLKDPYKERVQIQRYIFRRSFQNKTTEYTVELRCPEFVTGFYEPVWREFLKTLKAGDILLGDKTESR